MRTMNEDGFDQGEHGQGMEEVEPHVIVYGANGWTDALDDFTISLLHKIGAIRHVKEVAGPGFETQIYVSVDGREPR